MNVAGYVYTALPAQVHVGPYTYDVSRTDAIFDANNSKLLGESDHETLTIKVALNLPPGQAKNTLLHEIIHAVDYVGQIGLSESQVSQLANLLQDVLKRNDLDLR